MEVRKKKSVFILGGGVLQVPAIKKAKEKGLMVFVLDYDIHAPGLVYADEYLNISTIDKEEVLRAAQMYEPDYIITSVTDMPVRTVSWVCERLGKKTDISYNGAIVATDKYVMRNRMKECGVPIPLFWSIQSFDDFELVRKELPDRIVLKPADNSGSRGVVITNNSKSTDFRQIIDYVMSFSRSGKVLVEEYMEGTEVSVEAFSIDGIPHIIAVTDKLVTEAPYAVEIGHIQPSCLEPKTLEEVRRVAEVAIRAIGMINGPTHTEIKITDSGAKLVEIAARGGGDFISDKLVKLSTGVDMVECSFAILMDEEVPLHIHSGGGSAIRFLFCEKEGVLREFAGLEAARRMRGVVEVESYRMPGDRIEKLKCSSDRIGHIITTGNNAEEAACNAKKAWEEIHIVL